MDAADIAAKLTDHIEDAWALAWALTKDDTMNHDERTTLEADMRAALQPVLANHPKREDQSLEQYAGMLAAMTALVVRTEASNARE